MGKARSAVVVVVACVVLLGGPVLAWCGDTLDFVRDGKVLHSLDRAAIEKICRPSTIEVDDPYYGRRMSFVACPLEPLLALAFAMPKAELAQQDFLLHARDGYVKPASGRRLVEPGGYIALADAAREKAGESGFAPIDRRQVDPAPFYMVWQEPSQHDTNLYPWPYQLVRIEIGSIADQYADIAPRTATKGSEAWRGFTIFTTECVACHAVNGQGGKVGPDLNVPQSIVDYRPIEQIKAYVRDPETFRHTSMPAHRHLTPAQLDELIAYFQVMSTLKHDPGRMP